MKQLYKILFAILLIGSISTLQAQITVSYGYDELHRLKTCTYSNGMVVSYTYDALGNRSTVVISGNAVCIPVANLSVSNIGSTGATLNWTYTTGQTYTVEYKASSSSTWITASTSVSNGSYSLTGLSAATTYNWRVKANCSASLTNGTDFTTISNCVDVSNLSVSNIGSTGATLNWTYTTGQTYTVEYKASSSSTWITASTTVSNGSYSLTGLSAATTYNWRVKANCSASPTNGTDFTTISNCVAVSNLTVSNIGSTGATLNWNFASGQTYTVEYKASSSSTWITASTTVSSGSYSLTGLSAATTYNWRVKANCSASPTNGIDFTTLIYCVPVTDLSTSNITSNAVTLNWTYTAGYSYTLEWKAASATTWILASSSVNLGTFTGSGLSPNTTYDLRVKSNCSANFTDTIRITTLNNCTYPTANYAYSTNGLVVTINNTSSNANSYSWNFGNGQTSTLQNPSVTFSSAGTYNICLTATNSCGSTSYCQNVTVNSTCVKPTAQFTFVSNGLTTNFTNASLNGVSYNWNFGNGQTSTLQNPNITYTVAGTYNVCLTATNACDTNKVCKMIAVSTCDTVNKYDIYNVLNTVPQINKEGYYYYNGTHYLVWSNGHYTQSNPNNSYDAKVKLSTSTDGKTWTTQNILNTTIGSTEHVITIDSMGKIHLAYVEGVTGGYYGLLSSRLVYANNVSGTWIKRDSTLGSGNGQSYNRTSPYHLMYGYDGKLRMYYTNNGWWSYGAPLYMRVYDGSTWSSPVTIANTNDGGADSQNNLWSFTKKSNGQIQVYLSDGWRCTGSGCTETYYNNMRVFTEGANYTYSLTKNIPNTRWYFENKNSDSIKVNTDGKTVYVNNVLLNTLSGTEIIRNNTWIDNAKQYAIENTNTNIRVFKVTTGQSIVNNNGQYIIPANGFQIAVDYGANPRRLYTIFPNNDSSIQANFNASVSNLTVTLSNLSSGATSYVWNFGNGQTSTLSNPTITYSQAGNYTICLTASNACNSVQICKQVTVSLPQPNLVCNGQAIINPNPLIKGSPANMSMSVINTGQGAYNGMLYLTWRNATSGFYLDSANVNLQTGQVATLDMTSTGILSNAGTWYLQIEDRNRNVFCSTTVTVLECNKPVSSFSSSISGLTVSFQNNTLNSTSYLWNFGNGQSSTLVNPTITYVAPGNYTVCLTANNNCGSDDSCQSLNVIYTDIISSLNENILSIYPNPNDGKFLIKIQKGLAKEAKLEILNMEGRVVLEQAINNQLTEIITNNLANGVYLLNVQISNTEVIKHKLVIMR